VEEGTWGIGDQGEGGGLEIRDGGVLEGSWGGSLKGDLW
jgi:hypothetical protein